ncbi:MAG: CBS domain-containing protein [Halobacteriales archaeon]|nr:CBS domain-containing protein [Halobacteriales archaeon]
MSTDIVSCDRTATLRDVVGLMLENRVGSVIVLDGAAIDGIVSENDVLRASYDREEPLVDIPVEEIIEGPIITIDEDAPIPVAVDRMVDKEIKKLPVIHDFDLVGIITLTDIVYHLSDIREEAEALAFAHYRWQS